MSGTNVVPFQQGPQQPSGAPPGMMPNPAFAQWQQQAQQVQAIMAQNQQKQAQFYAAVALIKKDGMHGFRLDIEADSTIAPDEQAEKMARIEFLQQMVPLLEQIVPIAQGNPPLASLSSQITLFAVRGFRAGRPLEEAFEAAFDAIAKMPPNPKFTGQDQKAGTQQNPQVEMAKVQADVSDTQTKAKTDMLAIAQKQQQAQLQAQQAASRDAAEQERAQAQMGLEVAKMQQHERLENMRALRAESAATKGLS